MPNPISALRRFLDHRGVVTLFALGLLLLSTFVHSQTPVVLAPVPQLQFFDQSGNPLAFGCVSTFQVATTTPLDTFTDYTGITKNQNPVILSAGGSANIWLAAGQAYSFRVKSAGGSNCSSGSTLYTVNGIGGGSTTLTTVVPFSATPSFQDAAQNQLFTITLTGNASAQPLTFVGVTPPGYLTFQITQDGSGGHTFSWPANSVGGCTIGSGANQVTTQIFVYNGSNATALGPCVTGNGPNLSAGNISDFGLSPNGTVCTNASNLLVSSCGSVLNIAINGQTCAPGGACNVNIGAATHSITLNEGNGNAMAGVLLGLNQIPVGQTGADPIPSTIPTCTGGTSLTFSGTLPLTCAPSTAGQSASTTVLGSDVPVSGSSKTTFLTKVVTMPSSGCPCRVFAGYGTFLTTSSALIAEVWVDDGTNKFATSQVLVTGGATAFGTSASSFSTGTYTNSQVVTFINVIEASAALTVKAQNNDPSDDSQNTWLNIVVFTSN